ncbi:hypothetical protein EZS27_007635 [termite gut metagenome]|uniref:Phosphonopyruvate decarboxylase n=1 Tax=termite gut metagenome TaxID=433724 RepID=A0A5J4SFT0_9ZZZZ
MISPQDFIDILKKNDIDFFTGIPDSLLKDVCAYMSDNLSVENNIIAANEGSAVGLAAGYYLATHKIPVVYMQNSGIGNAINPLLSLVDKEVYNIPLLLLIGWRGEPGIKDEPQHIKQGKVTLPLLDVMELKNTILSKDKLKFEEQLKDALSYIRQTKEPYALVIQKNTFESYSSTGENTTNFPMARESAIRIIAELLTPLDIVVSTTGMISRELFGCRESLNQGHANDFLTVGSMGHASQIALGIALRREKGKIYCFDGDGALLMHMGSMAIIGSLKPINYIHVLFNNGAHDSVGGQPTVGLKIDLPNIGLSCGYNFVFSTDKEDSLKELLKRIERLQGPILLEVKVSKGYRSDLGRPATAPIQNKEELMNFLVR